MNLSMSEPDMHDILAKGFYGHLGCIMDEDQPLVLPIAYAYANGKIYSFSFGGQKINAMRQRPAVCFQVEKVFNCTGWKSVVVHGTYREITDEREKGEAMGLLTQRLWDAGNQEKQLYMPFQDSLEAMERAMADTDVVLYCIDIAHMTGRVEQYE